MPVTADFFSEFHSPSDNKKSIFAQPESAVCSPGENYHTLGYRSKFCTMIRPGSGQKTGIFLVVNYQQSDTEKPFPLPE
jgi:hypothetical protein